MHFIKIFILSYRKRAHNSRPADGIQLENDWVTNSNSHTAFDNPAFGQDPIYDSISQAKGGSVTEKIRQWNNDDGSNGTSNPTYDVANDEDHGIEDPEPPYASLEKEKDDDGSNGISNPTYDVANDGDYGIEDPEPQYASLEKEKESNLPQDAATDDDNYAKIKHEDESHA